MKKHYSIFLLCATLIMACATSPTGRRQLMLVSEDSAIAASKQAYVEMLKPYAQQGKIDNNPVLKDRVYRITGRLIAQALKVRPETKDWDWSIKIIDDPETVNAWAMAGGKMALYTGLVKKIKPTDDELAQVLGLGVDGQAARDQAAAHGRVVQGEARVGARGGFHLLDDRIRGRQCRHHRVTLGLVGAAGSGSQRHGGETISGSLRLFGARTGTVRAGTMARFPACRKPGPTPDHIVEALSSFVLPLGVGPGTALDTCVLPVPDGPTRAMIRLRGPRE